MKKNNINSRLIKIEAELDAFKEILLSLGKDISRPINAAKDGYYETALTHAGAIVEEILRDIWKQEKISGNPRKKTIGQMLPVLRDRIEIDRLVDDYIRDIQTARNRAAHSLAVIDEDSIEVLRKLSKVLDWYIAHYKEIDGLKNAASKSIRKTGSDSKTKKSGKARVAPRTADKNRKPELRNVLDRKLSLNFLSRRTILIISVTAILTVGLFFLLASVLRQRSFYEDYEDREPTEYADPVIIFKSDDYDTLARQDSAPGPSGINDIRKPEEIVWQKQLSGDYWRDYFVVDGSFCWIATSSKESLDINAHYIPDGTVKIAIKYFKLSSGPWVDKVRNLLFLSNNKILITTVLHFEIFNVQTGKVDKVISHDPIYSRAGILHDKVLISTSIAATSIVCINSLTYDELWKNVIPHGRFKNTTFSRRYWSINLDSRNNKYLVFYHGSKIYLCDLDTGDFKWIFSSNRNNTVIKLSATPLPDVEYYWPDPQIDEKTVYAAVAPKHVKAIRIRDASVKWHKKIDHKSPSAGIDKLVLIDNVLLISILSDYTDDFSKHTVMAIDSQIGRKIWESTSDADGIFKVGNNLLLNRTDSSGLNTLCRINPETGEELWTFGLPSGDSVQRVFSSSDYLIVRTWNSIYCLK